MTTPTVAVTIVSDAFTGAPVAGGSAILQLTDMDVVAGTNGATVTNPVQTFPLDTNGEAVVQLFPNAISPVGLGTRGTQYKVTILNASGAQVGSGFAQIPNTACNLHDNLVNIANPTGLTDGVVAVQLARSYRDQAQAVLSDAGFVAVKNDLPNIEAVAVSIGNVNTVEANLPAINTNASNMAAIQSAGPNATAAQNAQTQANSNMLTAIAQAALASTMALAAASVAQQDLSGTAGSLVALHRSPNAVVAQAIYETWKDSDGGAWINKVDASYLYEPLNGTWLTNNDARGLPAELDARCVTASAGAEMVLGTAALLDPNASLASDGTLTLKVGGPNASTTLNLSGAVSTSALYRVTVTVTAVGGVGGFFRLGAAGSSAFQCNAKGTLTFVVQGGGTNALLYLGPYAQSSDSFTAKFSVKQITGSFAPSGSYYQSATDGKFYRLWKNRLAYTSALSNAAWSKQSGGGGSAPVVTDGYGGVAAPDGTFTASRVQFQRGATNSSSDYSAITQGTTLSLPTVHSVWLRTTDGSAQTIGLRDIGNGGGINLLNVTGTWTQFSLLASSSTTFFQLVTGLGYATTQAADVLVWEPQTECGTSITTFEAKVSDGSQTETFRGNKARYPRADFPIAEAGRVAIYDALEPGRPLWKVLVAGANNAIRGTTISGVTAGNGWLAVATNSGLSVIDFANDRAYNWGTGGRSRYLGNLANANAGAGWIVEDSTKTIAGNTVNAVSACVMPDAPCDPATGLQVPTIAVATASYISLIQNNGTVVNSTEAGFTSVSITPYALWSARQGIAAMYFYLAPGKATGSFTHTLLNIGTYPDFSRGATNGIVKQGARGRVGRIPTSQAIFDLLVLNEGAIGASLAAAISDTSNTGWMVGDIRRAYLCDTLVGTVSGAELNTGAWASDATGTSTIATVGSELQVTTTAAGGYGRQDQTLTLTVGKTYRVSGSLRVVSGTGSPKAFVYLGTASGGFGATKQANTTSTAVTPFSFVFTATQATNYLVVGNDSASTDAVTGFTGISAQECVADRSYKASALQVFGTLTRSQVNTGSQLTAISGFSAANYLREAAYGADLDFSTGQWRMAAWVSYTTAVTSTIMERSFSSGAYITLGTDASGHLTATAYDGTTARTVTSTAAHNTGTYIKAVVEYSTSGSLTLRVNGQAVAQTTGAPLLTLNNASAVLTVGQNYGLTAPFPGSICLVKPGATTATSDQSTFCYEQEKEMFVAGAQCTLPDSGNVVDLDYDPQEDKWKPVSAANESSFVGLVRTATAPVSAGSFTHVSHRFGMKLLSRSTTNPGVDVTLPPLNLQEQLLRRAEAAANAARLNEPLDWSGQFTATTAVGSTALTSVSGLVYPSQASPIGAKVSGAGIPAGAVITDIQGTTVYISAPATAAASGVAISLVSFPQPRGYEAKAVYSGSPAGRRREGSGWDYTRAFDGFIEQVVFSPSAPGNVNVQFDARRIAV